MFETIPRAEMNQKKTSRRVVASNGGFVVFSRGNWLRRCSRWGLGPTDIFVRRQGSRFNKGVKAMAKNLRMNAPAIMRQAASSCDVRQLTECLVDFKCSGKVNSADDDGYTALHHACRSHNQRSADVVAILLEHGANPNAKTANLSTCLHIACVSPGTAGVQQTGAIERVVNALVDADADPLARDSNGLLPLHLAASCGLTNVVLRLLGVTAKFVDAGQGSVAVVLAPHVSMSDRYGLKAFDWAKSGGFGDTAEVLFLCEFGNLLQGILGDSFCLPQGVSTMSPKDTACVQQYLREQCSEGASSDTNEVLLTEERYLRSSAVDEISTDSINIDRVRALVIHYNQLVTRFQEEHQGLR